MTDILKLDLNDDGDEGLLVGFGKREARLPSRNNDSQALFAEVTPTKRTLLGNIWGRSNRKNNPPQDTNSLLDSCETKESGTSWVDTFNDEQKESARRHSDLKTTTFSFPNAPCVHAIDDEFFAPLPTLNETNDPILDERNENSQEDVSEDDEEDESDDDESGDEESEERASPEPKTESPVPNQRSKWDYEVYNESQPRQWTKEGFGSDPLKAEKKGVFGFLGRLGRSKSDMLTVSEQREIEREMKRAEQKSLRSMKVATESTKDDKTLAESIAKAAMIVLVPELYGDDEEETLGMYRSISTKADEDVAGPRTPFTEKIYALQKRIKELEKQVKSAELEANSWKLRAKELEDDLRNCRGGDSSDDDDEESESKEDDGIEEIYQEPNLLGDAVVVQGPGVDGPNLFHAECPEQLLGLIDALSGKPQYIDNSCGAMNEYDSQFSMSSTSLRPLASFQETVSSTAAFDQRTPVSSDDHMNFLNQPTPFSEMNGDASQSTAVVSYDPMDSLPRATSTAIMNSNGLISSTYASSNPLKPTGSVWVTLSSSENPAGAFDPMAPVQYTSTVSCDPTNSFNQPTSLSTMDNNGLLLVVNAPLSSSQTSEPLMPAGFPSMPIEMPPPPPPPVPSVEPIVEMCPPPPKPPSFDPPPPPSTRGPPTEDDVVPLPAGFKGIDDAVYIQVEPTTSDPPCAVMPPPDTPPTPLEESQLPEIVPAMEETEGETSNPSDSDPPLVPPMHPQTSPEHFQGREVEVPAGETLTPPESDPP